MENIKIRVAGAEPNSTVNGPKLRYVLFTQGCKHHCEGCHNTHTWPFEGGKLMTIDEIIEDIKSNMPLIKGVTLSGGDPMEQAEAIYYLCDRIKFELALNIWCYTGYTYEELIKENDMWKIKVLNTIDTLVDGRFDINDTKGDHPYRGSNNQKVLSFFTADNILTCMTGGKVK
jgi:anaerobic ribonucleoside-triphosphate reductase activating protein